MKHNVHAFNVELATKYSIEEALLLQHFYYWYQNNKGKEYYTRDGRIWTYNSLGSICEILPYFNKTKVFRTLEKIEEGGFVVTGNYNKLPFDKTKWYALTQKGIDLFEGKSVTSTERYETPAVHSETPAVHSETPAVHSETPAVHSETAIPNLDSNTDSKYKKLTTLDTLDRAGVTGTSQASVHLQEAKASLPEMSGNDPVFDLVNGYSSQVETQAPQSISTSKMDISLEDVIESANQQNTNTSASSREHNKLSQTSQPVYSQSKLDSTFTASITRNSKGQTCYIGTVSVVPIQVYGQPVPPDTPSTDKRILIPVQDYPTLLSSNYASWVFNWNGLNKQALAKDKKILVRSLSLEFQDSKGNTIYTNPL